MEDENERRFSILERRVRDLEICMEMQLPPEPNDPRTINNPPTKQRYCSECDADLYLVVDGKHMTEEELLRYDRVPKSIKRLVDHRLWCSERERTLGR